MIFDTFEPKVVIENPIISLRVGDSFQFVALYYNEQGIVESASFTWTSSNPPVITMSGAGVATAMMTGSASITVEANGVSEQIEVEAGETTMEVTQRVAELVTVSSYPMQGTATLQKNVDGLILALSSNFSTSPDLPGLFIYLANNPSTISGALEITEVTNFSGSQVFDIPEGTGLFTYKFVMFFCKPFNVPVGKGELMP